MSEHSLLGHSLLFSHLRSDRSLYVNDTFTYSNGGDIGMTQFPRAVTHLLFLISTNILDRIKGSIEGCFYQGLLFKLCAAFVLKSNLIIFTFIFVSSIFGFIHKYCLYLIPLFHLCTNIFRIKSFKSISIKPFFFST